MHGRFIYWMERETCPVYSLSLFFSPSSHPFVFASLSFPAFLPFTDRKPAHSSLSFYVSPSVNLSIHSSFLVFLSMLLPTRDLRITFSLYQFLPLSVCLDVSPSICSSQSLLMSLLTTYNISCASSFHSYLPHIIICPHFSLPFSVRF